MGREIQSCAHLAFLEQSVLPLQVTRLKPFAIKTSACLYLSLYMYGSILRFDQGVCSDPDYQLAPSAAPQASAKQVPQSTCGAAAASGYRA